MRTELPCEIVQDLLPSYIDELTSETTRESVDGHLEHCEDCRKVLRFMKNEEQETTTGSDAKEVDFLKKTRKRGMTGVICAIMVTALLTASAIGIKAFVMAKDTSSYLMGYQVERTDEGFEILGNLIDSTRGVRKVIWEEEGSRLNIRVRSTGGSFFSPNYFESLYRPAGEIDTVTLNGSIIVWEDGESIPREAAAIYNDRTPYVGNIEAIGRLAMDTGLSYHIKESWTTELQTKQAPYGWALNISDDIDAKTFAAYEQSLPAYAAALIATIDNLSYMDFNFPVKGEIRNIHVTEADADALLGTKAKEFIQGPKDVAKLIKLLKIRPGRNGEISMAPYVKDNFQIHLQNNCDEDVYGIGISFAVNGNARMSGVVSNANGNPLSKRDVETFTFIPEDSDFTVDMARDEVTIEISFYCTASGKDPEGNTITLELDPDDPKYYDGKTYERFYSLTGSKISGFSVSE